MPQDQNEMPPAPARRTLRTTGMVSLTTDRFNGDIRMMRHSVMTCNTFQRTVAARSGAEVVVKRLQHINKSLEIPVHGVLTDSMSKSSRG
jgi:hypothetical protein